ncbi:MAG: 3'-5' exonuclease, partial [Rudaea sp.]
EFLEYVETLRSVGAREGEAPAEAEGSVRLMTIHKAKGLEFPVVVLADASRGRPSSRTEVLFSSELGVTARPADEKRAPLSFALAQAADLDREKAEDRRLLYVAATRAQDKLIICGHKTTAKNTWMSQLAEAASIDLDALVQKPAAWQTAVLNCGQEVQAIAAPMPSTVDKMAPAARQEKSATSLAPLYVPIALSRAGETDGKRREDEQAADQARRLTSRTRRADSMLVGRLLHAAVRRWRFAPEAAVDALLRAEAFRFGLIDEESLQATLAHVKLLLERFAADPLWAEINAAARQHEIPFTFILDGTVATGSIDLLYKRPAGRWRIVDFKTDALAGEAEMRDRMNRHHISQMRRYQNAARTLLHESPEGLILFLDLAGKLRIEFVEG